MGKTSSKKQGTASKTTRRKGESPAAVKQTKKQIAWSRREARQNRIIWLSVGALALVILAVVAVGLVLEYVTKPASPVAIVEGNKIRTDDFQALLCYRRYNLHMNEQSIQNALDSIDTTQESSEFLTSFYEQQLQQITSALSTAAEDSLDEMIDHELIRQKAVELRVTVADADVTAAIQEDLESAVSSSAQTTITDTTQAATPVPQEQVDEFYQTILGNMGITDKAFRGIVQRSLLQEKVQEELASQVITTGLVIQVQLIETDTQEQAQAAMERIEAGEDWAVVAQEVSTDTTSAENGGDLGWVTTGQLSQSYGEALETQAFSLEVGNMTLVESDERFFVVRVSDRNENGPLPTDVLTQRQDSALSDWLEERKNSPDLEIERLLESDQIPTDPFTT